MKMRIGMGNGDVDMAATTGEKKGELVGRGMQKNDQRQNGKQKSQQNDPEIQKPNKKTHIIFLNCSLCNVSLT